MLLGSVRWKRKDQMKIFLLMMNLEMQWKMERANRRRRKVKSTLLFLLLAMFERTLSSFAIRYSKLTMTTNQHQKMSQLQESRETILYYMMGNLGDGMELISVPPPGQLIMIHHSMVDGILLAKHLLMFSKNYFHTLTSSRSL